MNERFNPTISDVASQAGVSKMTVSRVLNGKGDVSKETAAKVTSVIKDLGYRPSSMARGLVTGKTQTIGLLLTDVTSPFFARLIRGIEDQALAKGYSVVICSTAEDPAREMVAVRMLQDKRVDGIIWYGSRLPDKELRTVGRSVAAGVLVNRNCCIDNFGIMLLDYYRGAYAVTRHLLELGHRRIGLIKSPVFFDFTEEKVRGYSDALGEYGVQPATEWMVLGAHQETYRELTSDTGETGDIVTDHHIRGGREAARVLLTEHPEITAIITCGDMVACGVLLACRDLGRRVPDDLAVAGFGGTILSGVTCPPLTTVDLPLHRLGRAAFDLLVDIASSGTAPASPQVFEPRLVVRSSTVPQGDR